MAEPEPDCEPDPEPKDALAKDAAPLDAAEVRDALPEDLNAEEFVGPYVFPNNNRRRKPGYLYIALAAVLALLYLTRSDGAVLINGGIVLGALILAAAGAIQLQAGWNLDVDEHDALALATAEAGFPVGHAAAQMGWRGIRSRPTWRILVYSNEEPPTKRGMVMVDGVDGGIVDRIIEDNPEDWSDFDLD